MGGSRATTPAYVTRLAVARLKRVRNPDVVSLELIGSFPLCARSSGIGVWVAAVERDLPDALADRGLFMC